MGDVKHSAFAWLARFWRDRTTLLIALIAGLGTAHILVRTAPYGTAVSLDSTMYLSTALNFLAGEGWRDFADRPMVQWPPLFPLLLVAGGWVGIEPLEAGRWINATAFGLTILAAGCWLRSHLQSRWLTLVATAVFVASLPLSYWASFLQTESLFILLTLLALIWFAAFLNRRTAAPLWWAAIFTALAALTRYPGVVLIGVGVLVLLVRRAPPLAARLRDSIVFGAVSSIPLAGVLTRNWAISGTLTGPRGGSGQSLSDSLSQVADGFRAWAIPPNAPDGLGYLLSIAAGLVVLAAGVVVVRHGREKGMDRMASPSFGLGPALPFGVFAVAYLVFIVTIVPLVIPFKGIPGRFLVPVYVPVLLVAVFLLDRFLSIEATGWMGAVRYGLASLVLLGTLAHVGCSARENLRRTAHVYKAGYSRDWSRNAARWQHSEILNYIRDNHIEGRIYSNRPAFAWFWDRTAALRKLRTYRNIPRNMEWAEIEAGAHIVWLNRAYDRERFGYDALDVRLLPGIEVVAELPDGTVLCCTAAEPFDAKRHRARKQRYVNQLIQQASEHVRRAGWTVYRTGRTLIYRKEPCAPADVQAKFVLHVVPADPADLPAHRQQYDSENLGFSFNWSSLWRFRLGDQCIAIVPLPAYAIDRIHVGQWIAKDNRTLWKADLEMHRSRKQRYVNQLIQQASEQVRRAGWTVYRTGRTLIYRKEPCTSADVQAKFVLHVVPADPADLPAHRQQYDSENLDFYFRESRRKSPSFRLGDQCIAIAQLPAYAIDRIHVGQWIAKEDRTLWKAEFSPGR